MLYKRAAAEFESKSNVYVNDPMEVEMLARVANIYGDMLGDPETAKIYADKAASINPGQAIRRFAYRSANIDYDPQNYEDKYVQKASQYPPEVQPKPKSAESNAEFISLVPNPANPVSTITYSIALPSHVQLSIYSISGQKVATLVDTYRDAGVHTATFDGSNMASGLYFYHFESDSFSSTGKLMILK